MAEPRLGFGAGWGKQRGSLPALGTEEGTEEGSVLCPLKKNTQPNSFKLSLGAWGGGEEDLTEDCSPGVSLSHSSQEPLLKR